VKTQCDLPYQNQEELECILPGAQKIKIDADIEQGHHRQMNRRS